MDARKARLHDLEFPVIPGSDSKKDREVSLQKRMSYAIAAGYFMNAATRCVNDSVYKCLPLIDGKTKKTTSGTTSPDVRLVHMHPQSVYATLKPSEFVIFQELVNSTKLYIKNVAKVSGKVLEQHQKAWHFVDPRLLNGEEATTSLSSSTVADRDRRQRQNDDREDDPVSKRTKVEENTNHTNHPKSGNHSESSTDKKTLSAVEQAKLRYLSRKGGK